MKTRLAAINVDLDEIPNYYAIHGLTPIEPRRPWSTTWRSRGSFRLGVARGAAHALRRRLRSRAFESAAALRAARLKGARWRDHTLDHRYDLTRLTPDEMRAQVWGGIDAIAVATGEEPLGFRAPGYTITDELFGILREADVAYDASVFPCPAYYAAKTAAIGLIALRGRTSRSIVDTPEVLFAPRGPYRISDPYWRVGSGMLEIPVQVTRGPRLLFIGTSVTLAGPDRARLLAELCVDEPLVNLELHGIDVLDAADGLEPLRPHQPDVRVPKERKLAALEAVTDVLEKAGYGFVTMREAARFKKRPAEPALVRRVIASARQRGLTRSGRASRGRSVMAAIRSSDVSGVVAKSR
ncbi:MAG: polysaccharide deacetylase family protein [Polyangiaceae bacterium]